MSGPPAPLELVTHLWCQVGPGHRGTDGLWLYQPEVADSYLSPAPTVEAHRDLISVLCWGGQMDEGEEKGGRPVSSERGEPFCQPLSLRGQSYGSQERLIYWHSSKTRLLTKMPGKVTGPRSQATAGDGALIFWFVIFALAPAEIKVRRLWAT